MFSSRCDFKLVFLPQKSSRKSSKATEAHWLGTKNRQIHPLSSLEKQGHQLDSTDGESHCWALCLSATIGRAIGGLCNIPSFLVRLPG